MYSLIDEMNVINSETDFICDYIKTNPPGFAQVSTHPRYTKEHEIDSSQIHTHISADFSENPIDELCAALEKKYIDSDESGKLVQRWSGLIVYPNDEPFLKASIFRLNESKLRFKKIVQEFGLSNSAGSASHAAKVKFDFVHDTFSMLATSYVYRTLHTRDGNFTAAYWAWLRAKSSRTFTKSALLKNLERQISDSLLHPDADHIIAGIKSTIASVSQSSCETYIQRSTQPPRPNLTMHFEDERPPAALYGGLPVFVFNQTNMNFNYKPIKPFDLSAISQRKKRIDIKDLKHFKGDLYVEA